MRKTILIFMLATVAALCALPGSAADNATSNRRDKKAQKSLVDSVHAVQAAEAVSNQYWVLIASQIVPQMGPIVSGLDTDRNFVLVQNDRGIVQMALNGPHPGFNGLGGVTLKGRVSNYRVSTDKKGNTHCTFRLHGSHVDAHVMVSLNRKNDGGVADISGTVNGSSFRMRGRVAPYQNPNLKLNLD